MARQRGEVAEDESGAQTRKGKSQVPTVRLKPDIHKMVAMLAIHHDTSAGEILDPLIRPKITAMFQDMMGGRK